MKLDLNKKKTYKEYEHRKLTSHMMWSHIFLIIPALWWLFGKNDGPFLAHCFDKFMAIILTISILTSLIYHRYYERVIINSETYLQFFGAIVLNLYLFYRGVPYYIILFGLVILLLLYFYRLLYTNSKNNIYDKYHPYAHYGAGFYILYCVYFIQRSFDYS